VVRFLILKGLSSRDIHTELESVYMDESLGLCTVYKWHGRFMQGRTELFDGPRFGRSPQNDLADALRVMI
jgi:transposase